MLYLLDANVLIRAHEDYYGLEQVPQFWEWIVAQAEADVLKLPYEIFEEISVSTGPLGVWINDSATKKSLVLDETVDPAALNHVLVDGYAPDLNDSEIEKIGRDPFLIAYALTGTDRVVVTKETSKPSKTRANRKIPDVCNDLSASCTTDFAFFKAAGFRAR